LEHGLCMLDESGSVTVANERALRTFELPGIPQLMCQPFGSALVALASSGRVPHTATDRLSVMSGRRESGKELLAAAPSRYYEATVSSRGVRCVLLFENISERIADEERINFMAQHDMLNELPNRSYFSELALEELAMRREAGRASALMIF